MSRMRQLLRTDPIVPNMGSGRPFELDIVLRTANELFIEHNVRLINSHQHCYAMYLNI